MRRVVFDCMIFLQAAARSTGPAGALLELAENGTIQLVVSVEILDEIGYVLRRPELITNFKSLTPQLVDEFLSRLQICSETVEPVPKVFVYERDPKDEKYVNLAIASKSDVLVSRDKDILSLRDQNSPLRMAFGDQLKLQILDPVELLQILRQENA